MRGPLSVRVDDGTVDRHVSLATSGLRWKKSAYGGDVDLTCLVQVPRGTFADLNAGDSITVYDARTGSTRFGGNIDYPGVVEGPGGQAFDIQAFGGAARLQAKRQALAYVLTGLDNWVRSKNSTKGAQTSNEERGAQTPALEVHWNKGFDVDDGDIGEWRLTTLADAGLKLGRVTCSVDAGLSSAGYKQRITTGSSVDSLSTADSRDADTSAGTLSAIVGSGIGASDDVAGLRAVRTGGGVNAAKTHWFQFWNIAVRQKLKDTAGNDLTTGYGGNTILASQVVADMVGRGMAPGAVDISIEDTTWGIDSLAWTDGVTFSDAMQSLLTFEPELFWMLSGSRLTVGLWDTDNPRYVISKRDGGVVHPGAEFTKCNRVLVSYTDARGKEQTLTVTADVEGLDYTRDAEPVSLPDGFGSAANAQRAGEQALIVANRKPKAGTAVIRRPILDQWQGCLVMPWEIEPGACVLEQETGWVLRLTEVEYDHGSASAALTLDKPPETVEQRIARLERVARRRRRK